MYEMECSFNKYKYLIWVIVDVATAFHQRQLVSSGTGHCRLCYSCFTKHSQRQQAKVIVDIATAVSSNTVGTIRQRSL